MKFATGKLVRVDDNGYQFEDYTVDHFMKQLTDLRDADYKTFRSTVEMLCNNSGTTFDELMSYNIRYPSKIFDDVAHVQGPNNGWAYMESNSIGKNNDFAIVRKVIGYKLMPSAGVNGKPVLDAIDKLPKCRHTNFYTNGLPMFNFFIADPTNDPKHEGLRQGHVYIQFNYYVNGEDIYEDQIVDTHIMITDETTESVGGKTVKKYHGYLDIDQHLPYVLDEWCSDHYRAITGDSKLIYIMSPLQALSVGIIDKMRQILSVKTGKASARLLKLAIEQALLRDKQGLTSDLNKQMQIVSRLKLLPKNQYKDRDGNDVLANAGADGKHTFAGSHWFNWFDNEYKSKSYSDVFSKSGNSAQFSIQDYERVLQNYSLNITFLSEKNMNDGLYCIDNTDFKKFLVDKSEHNVASIVSHYVGKTDIKTTNIDSVLFMTDGSKMLDTHMIASIVDLHEQDIDTLDYVNKMKKVMQRIKLEVCQKYEMTMASGMSSEVIKGNEINEFKFDRFLNYYPTRKDKAFKKHPKNLNVYALAAFLEGDNEAVTNLTFEEYQAMSPEELQVLHQQLDGVSCDAWCTNEFATSTNMIVDRTFTINCGMNELSQNMLTVLKQIDDFKAGKRESIDQVQIVNKLYKSAKTLTHYTVECPECGSRMVPGEEDYVTELNVGKNTDPRSLRPEERLSPWTKFFFCKTCNHHMENTKRGFVDLPYDALANELEQQAINSRDALVKANFIHASKKAKSYGYNRIIFKDYKEHEDGIDLKLSYVYDTMHPRITGSTSLTKAVLAPINDERVGVAKELTVVHPKTGEPTVFYDVQLDMLLPVGAVKAKKVALMNSAIALNNAVYGTEDEDCIYTINKYIETDNPDLHLKELNHDVIKNFKRTPVERRVWTPFIDNNGNASGRWETKIFNYYVGLIPISCTEVAQEFSNTYTFRNPRKFSLNNCDHMQQLGFNDLYNSIYDQNIRAFSNNKLQRKIDSELLKILGCLMHPVINGDTAHPNNDKIFQYLTDSSGMRLNKVKIADFQQERKNSITIANWVPYSEYKSMTRTHPIFSDKFTNGTYGIFVFAHREKVRNENKESIDKDIQYKYHLRFPSNTLLNYLVDISANGMRARYNDIYVHFMSLFQELSSSYEVNTDRGAPFLRRIGSETGIRRANTILKLKRSIIDYFMTKTGQFAMNSALNLPAIGSKQIGSVLVPWDVVIIPDDANYRRVVSQVMNKTYEAMDIDIEYNYKIRRDPRSSDYTQETLNNNLYFKEVYGFVHRDPVLWRQQNYWGRVWSRHKANHEFKKMYGVTYDDLFPGSKAIMLNSVRMVIDQESDIDGDWVCVGIPMQFPDTVNAIKEYIDESNNNGFFQPSEHYEDLKTEYVAQGIEPHTDKFKRLDKYKILSDMSAKVRFEYLMDEASDLFTTYPDELFYDLSRSRISRAVCREALLESAESKKDIGFLTTSMRQFTYILNYLKDLGQRDSSKYLGITDDLEIMATFVFQYMLVQREAVRAVKADGAYGKLTLDAIIRNAKVRVPGVDPMDAPRARELFEQMLINFDDKYGTYFAWQSELTHDERKQRHAEKIFDCHSLIVHICDNFMITDMAIKNEGGGYVREYTPDGTMSIYQGKKQWDGSESNTISPEYKDLKGILYMIIGNNYSPFLSSFNESSLFNGIYTNVLNKVPLLKNFGRDINLLISDDEE